MKKQIILLIAIVSLSFECFLPQGFAQSGRIINKDTYGAYDKEEMNKLSNMLSTKDEEAFWKLIISGQIVPIKKGTRVFLEDTAIWEGLIKVRPQGQTRSIWIFSEHSTAEEDYNNSAQNEPNKKKDSINSGYKIEGIVYDKVKPAVIIGGKIHFVNDSVGGMKIIAINQDNIEVQQEEGAKTLKIGDSFQVAP